MKHALLFLAASVLPFALAEEPGANGGFHHPKSAKTGAICLGPDLSKTFPDRDIFLSVDGSPKERFSGSRGRIPFADLELNKKHLVRLFKGDQQFNSFTIDFKGLKSNFVVIWKAAGAWKAIPVGGEKCEWPVPRCPEGSGCS